MAESGYKVSTIERHLVSISQRFEASGQDSPAKSLMVRQVMKGIRRELGAARQGKSPILTKHIKRWLDSLGDDITAKRDRAMVPVGFAGGFRRADLVALQYSDLEFMGKGVIVYIRHSKTDQESKGQQVGIVYGKDAASCPVKALESWLEAAGIKEGPVFRRIKEEIGLGRNRSQSTG